MNHVAPADGSRVQRSRYLACIRRGIDYVEQRLDQPLTLGDIAAAAGLSQWHFQRIFCALTHETLKTYIRSRRLAAALEALRDPGRRIIEIAMATGFESQASFTRAFSKMYLMTPGQYRKMGRRNLFPVKAAFDEGYLQHLHAGMTLSPVLQHWPAQRVIGMRTYFHGTGSDKNNVAKQIPPLWETFLARASEIADHAEPKEMYGLIKPEDDGSDRLIYVACAPVAPLTQPPEDMVAIDLPATEYACFTHRGRVADLDHTVNYAYGSWLLTEDYQHSGAWDMEVYDENYHPTSPDSVIRYAMPIVR
ncbi:AraC family transcriptional regulator [Leeia aquatica]|uniref:AraC family transcriptional regulator n=1 Tax=Leeia aquatica TaxID=2725557 RepID=A0A847SDK6_9NEIS|nr:GyrI-like domain-containing protein [Leeia aquatica]NLR74032.1 AraC family transcriptional regulator [Leeia aquatica]